MKKILALDVSGSCVGWAYGVDRKLEAYDKFIHKQSGSRGKKFTVFANWLKEILQAKKPDVVVIERPYRGRNSNVLVSLSKFIAIVEYQAYAILNLEIPDDCFVDPKTVKRILKVQKGEDYNDNKKLMVSKINQLYNLKLKFSPKKSKKYNDDDVADAIALLTAFWELHDDV